MQVRLKKASKVVGLCLALKVPAGSSSGKRLRVKGQGVQSKSGDAGDLYVELEIKLPNSLPGEGEGDSDLQAAVAKIESLYTEPVRENIVW